MRQVELYTDDGHFVAVVEIVPFPDRGMPKVIMWGDRVFVRALQDPPSQDFDPLRDRWPFREAFSVVSFTPSPGLPRETVSGPGPKSSARELLQSKAAEKGGAMMPIPPVDRSARCTIGEAVAPGVANTEDRGDGQQKGYVILCDEERAKGFVRPVRSTYRHLKCGATTTMGVKLSETYARDPQFYDGTFCCRCGAHFPVGPDGEFVWDGTDEKVGT